MFDWKSSFQSSLYNQLETKADKKAFHWQHKVSILRSIGLETKREPSKYKILVKTYESLN